MGEPLRGERILITREETKAAEMAEKVSKLGGSPVVVPMIEINDVEKPENKIILERLSSFEWVFITSANGVQAFFQLLQQHHKKLPQGLQFGIVGKKTEEVLEAYGYTASFVPSSFDALTMAEEFTSFHTTDKPVLLIRGNLSRQILPEKLREAQIPYETLEVYETIYCTESKQELNNVLSTIDYITFTSPSTIDAFVTLAEYIPDKAMYICIGKTTSERAKELGIPNLYTSDPYTTDAMLHLITELANERKMNHE
ncbi:uroporphyrinogen-III synthase [Oceanobacillus sp. CFH 90083]|uniref:uroporphyrinogen-III synthase n=1 Tax=Oceanobacillus sp. CFH 90083 TaxID=2592336 RepID=UPI00128B469C|nr:uroporphyrinogen-III synthase [Oceanobacillus sp. CFH 90083]